MQLPESLLQSLEQVKGFDRKAFEEVHYSGEQVTSIRINPSKWLPVHHTPFTTPRVPWCPYGYYLSERPSFTFDPLFHGGAYYVQEPSSMFLWQVLQQTVGEKNHGLKVLDLCAAPGGKTTLLASYFTDGLMVANEVIRSRVNILKENITKWGADNVIVSNNDPEDFKRLENYFDIIVIDAPCSGSGLFRKHPEAVKEWSEEAVMLCSRRQQRILADISPALKKGGMLIYATCSYSREENEEILDWITDHFEVKNLQLTLKSDWNIIESQSDRHNAYGYRFYPDKTKGEGFFISAFTKNEGSDSVQFSSSIPSLSNREMNVIKKWLKNDERIFFFRQKENILALDRQWMTDISFLQKHLYIRKAGINIGSIKGNDLVPDHEMALSLLVNDRIPKADFDSEQAIQYLRKKVLNLDNFTRGWMLADYAGINLGWMKILENRINNYYPAEWRILKD